jgi:hypothetical protein
MGLWPMEVEPSAVGGLRLEAKKLKAERTEGEKLRRCGPSAFGGLRLEAGKERRLEDEKI